ncbi:hypothetical protein AU14_00870 [Marinobacter similis]|uniref:Uncharacterized protein n=1 Tax=Marinobacter similis TaxID=1420916 RepID=W5YLK4_9GAMM|nr:hypothetical protein AU14_00870 [Marinobacter similis]
MIHRRQCPLVGTRKLPSQPGDNSLDTQFVYCIDNAANIAVATSVLTRITRH